MSEAVGSLAAWSSDWPPSDATATVKGRQIKVGIMVFMG